MKTLTFHNNTQFIVFIILVHQKICSKQRLYKKMFNSSWEFGVRMTRREVLVTLMYTQSHERFGRSNMCIYEELVLWSS